MDKKSQKSDSNLSSNKSASFEDAEGDNDNFGDCTDQEPKGKFFVFNHNFVDETVDTEREVKVSKSVYYVPEDTSNHLYAMEAPDEDDFKNNQFIMSHTLSVGKYSFADNRQ